MRHSSMVRIYLCFLAALIAATVSCSRNNPSPGVEKQMAPVQVHWDKVIAVSKTTPTLQVVVNPPLRRGSKIHDAAYQSLQTMGVDYVRYVPWLPYPKLGVAELEPPKDGKTSWDFSLIDPMTEDFINATAGHSVIVNFSTIPQWMYKTEKPVAYPSDPDQVTWDYEQGTELRDPSFKEVADYYARLVSWYTQGGFTDENGKRHESGHHYKIDYWEVLNEINYEHSISPETYTHLYDAVVAAIHKVDPKMKFVAMGLVSDYTAEHAQYFEYFLNPKNHQPGTPLDMISYHFYACAEPDEDTKTAAYTFFDQADRFLTSVRHIQLVRQRLSPQTMSDVDELGSVDPHDFNEGKPGYAFKDFPAAYWNLSGATYAYTYAELAKLGVEVAGESQWLGYPSQFPSVSMVDWNTGMPNPRAQVLRLIHDNFAPGDKLVETSVTGGYWPEWLPPVYAQGFVTPDGRQKMLLVNKRDGSFDVAIPGGNGAEIAYIDETTGSQPAAVRHLSGDRATLAGFAVAVVTLPK